MSKSMPDVVQAIKLSEMAGRAVTDTEVAALAAGQLTITDLVVPMGVPEDVEGEAEEEEDCEEQESVKEISLGEQEPAEDPKSVKLRDDMEGDDDWNEANKEKGNGETVKPVIGQKVVVQKEEDTEEEEEDEGSSSDSDSPETPRRKMAPFSFSDDEGEGDDDFIGDGIPMTENEEIESILPLGEVSMNDTEVIPVGTILSLVEPDGTIVIRGNEGQPPFDEGSVLSAVAQDTGSKEPMGRIHEIFGPCKVPHYTVRVEGAATKYQHEKRNKREEMHRHVQDARADNGEGGTAEAAALEPQASPSRTTHKDGEDPNPNAQEELAARMSAANEIQEKVVREEHPFRRWKVGTTVYVLKNHAKYLAKDLLVPRGKGSDASNKHDEEAEEEYFSDDQEEKKAKVREKENKRRNALAMQGVLPHEIEATIAEEREKRVAKANRRNACGRGRGGRGRGGFRAEAGGARGVGYGGRGNRHYGGRIGPEGFPAWRASNQPSFGLNPANIPMSTMPMHQQQQSMPPNQMLHPPQQLRNINGFVPGGQPLYDPMRQGDGYFPGRFNGPPPLQQQFPPGQHMPNPSQFVHHHHQQQQQLPQQRVDQMSGVYGAQPVNPVVSPRPQGESGSVNNGNGPVEVRLPGLGHIRLSISPTVPQP